MDFTQRYAQLPKTESPIVELSGGQQMMVAARAAEVIPIDGAEDTFKFIITTANIDRYNDIVQSKGGKLEAYAKNPVVLWNHNSWDHPIGKSLSQQVTDKEIIADAQFHSVTDNAKITLLLLQGGYLKATSIGFIPMEWTERTAEPNEELYHSPYTNIIREYTKWDLLEFSVVTVPANTGAVMTNSMFLNDPFVKAVSRAYEDGVLSYEDPGVKRLLLQYSPKNLKEIRPIINIKSITKRKVKMVSLTPEQVTQITTDFPPVVGQGFTQYLVDSFAVPEEEAKIVGDMISEANRQIIPQVLELQSGDGTTADQVTNMFKGMFEGQVDKKGAKLSKQTKEQLTDSINHMSEGIKKVKAVLKAAEDGKITDDEVEEINEGKDYKSDLKIREDAVKHTVGEDTITHATDAEAEAFLQETLKEIPHA